MFAFLYRLHIAQFGIAETCGDLALGFGIWISNSKLPWDNWYLKSMVMKMSILHLRSIGMARQATKSLRDEKL